MSLNFSWYSGFIYISKTCHEDQLHGINLRSVAFSWYTPSIYKIYYEYISEILCLYHICLFCFAYVMWLIHSILSLVIIFREQNHVLWFNLIHTLNSALPSLIVGAEPLLSGLHFLQHIRIGAKNTHIEMTLDGTYN